MAPRGVDDVLEQGELIGFVAVVRLCWDLALRSVSRVVWSRRCRRRNVVGEKVMVSITLGEVRRVAVEINRN